MVSRNVLIVEKHKAQTVRDFVESHHIFDKRYKIKVNNVTVIFIYIEVRVRFLS